jgi:hypothetical protein
MSSSSDYDNDDDNNEDFFGDRISSKKQTTINKQQQQQQQQQQSITKTKAEGGNDEVEAPMSIEELEMLATPIDEHHWPSDESITPSNARYVRSVVVTKRRIGSH